MGCSLPNRPAMPASPIPSLVRLAQRGRIERTARGVYRIPYVPLNRFSQYREAVLWAKAHRGPINVALSHETALLVLGSPFPTKVDSWLIGRCYTGPVVQASSCSLKTR